MDYCPMHGVCMPAEYFDVASGSEDAALSAGEESVEEVGESQEDPPPEPGGEGRRLAG